MRLTPSPSAFQRITAVAFDRLVTRSLLGLGIRAVEVVGKLLLYVLVAHRLGATDAGLYFVALTWLTLGSTIARMGLERSVMRHLPAELAVGHTQAAARILRWVGVWTLVGAGAIGGLTVALANLAAVHVLGRPEYGLPLALSAAILVPDAIAITVGAVLIGLKRSVAAQVVQNSLWPPLVLACVATGLDRVEDVLLATAGCRGLTALLGLVLLWRQRSAFGVHAGQPPAPGAIRVIWRTALPLYVVELVSATFISIPILMLGAYVDSAAVGAFSAANRLSMLTWVVLVSISNVMAPLFSEAHHTRQWADLRRYNRKARLVSSLAALPPLIAMMLLPQFLLELVGPGFGQEATALRILVAGQMINAVLPCQDTLLAMAGQGRVLRLLSLAQLATCVVLCTVLIPVWGVIGAALSLSLSTVQGAAGTMIAARRLVPEAFVPQDLVQ